MGGHGDGRRAACGRRGGLNLAVGHAPAPASRTRTASRSRARPGQHPVHDHERHQRHGHERRRRQRGGRLQHDDAQLALHRAHLPQAEAETLLADGNNGPIDIHMAESGCAPSLTAAAGDRRRAVRAGDQRGRARRMPTPAAAVAAGYVPASPTDYPVVTYVNPDHRGGQRGGATDARPPATSTVSSTPRCPRARRARRRHVHPPATVTNVPMPYGALVQWHRRTQVCGPATPSPDHALRHHRVTRRARAARSLQPTPYVSMVWQIPVAGGPLAIQPPDIQIVEAAVMQSERHRRLRPQG